MDVAAGKLRRCVYIYGLRCAAGFLGDQCLGLLPAKSVSVYVYGVSCAARFLEIDGGRAVGDRYRDGDWDAGYGIGD